MHWEANSAEQMIAWVYVKHFIIRLRGIRNGLGFSPIFIQLDVHACVQCHFVSLTTSASPPNLISSAASITLQTMRQHVDHVFDGLAESS